jgi:hypothetical protein
VCCATAFLCLYEAVRQYGDSFSEEFLPNRGRTVAYKGAVTATNDRRCEVAAQIKNIRSKNHLFFIKIM